MGRDEKHWNLDVNSNVGRWSTSTEKSALVDDDSICMTHCVVKNVSKFYFLVMKSAVLI